MIMGAPPKYDTSKMAQDLRERAVLTLLDHTPVEQGTQSIHVIHTKAKLDRVPGFAVRNTGELLRRLERNGYITLTFTGGADAKSRYIYSATITPLGTARLDSPPYTPTGRVRTRPERAVVTPDASVMVRPGSIDAAIRAIVQEELSRLLPGISDMITAAVHKAFD